MDKELVPLGFGSISVPLGSHIAGFYRNLQEHCNITIPFIKTGLMRGAKCVYVFNAETRDGLEGTIQGVGVDVDVEAALTSGQLNILSTEETYFSEGSFSPKNTLDLLETALRTAREEGYGEVRLTGDMTWALQERSGVEQLMEYEALLDQLLPDYPQIAICRYNLARFPGDIIIDVLKTHSDCILGGILVHNHFYQDPKVFLKELQERPV